jgi:hypothetical protein
VGEGSRLLQVLAQPLPTDTLVATDLHTGNILRSEREAWLVIALKAFIGDASYDSVQHLHNCEARLHSALIGTGGNCQGTGSVIYRVAFVSSTPYQYASSFVCCHSVHEVA